jgi:hypothetical protein
MLIVASAVISSGGVASADQLTAAPNVMPAPIGHAQPHANGFAPDSAGDKAEQDRLSAADAEQRKQDQMLDEQLNICRGC